MAGWWGTDPETRFLMGPASGRPPTADAWQVSNPPIFAMAPVRASLAMFDKVGMAALRERSMRLTGYLESLLDGIAPNRAIRVDHAAGSGAAGCQLSVRLANGARPKWPGGCGRRTA